MANIYMGVFEFFPHTALAVHLYEGESAGSVKLLLLPPVGCSTLKWNNDCPDIGTENTEQISRKIVSSSIEESSLPIKKFFAKNKRCSGF
jgi:hypothetical protein